jgi:hypothetical protein
LRWARCGSQDFLDSASCWGASYRLDRVAVHH